MGGSIAKRTEHSAKESLHPRESGRVHVAAPGYTPHSPPSTLAPSHDIYEREQQQQQEQEGQGHHQEKQQEKPKPPKKEMKRRVGGVQANAGSQKSAPRGSGEKNLDEVGDIFYRFMALMARILGQAEAEAHALYAKIKARTDDVDTLTELISKINSTKGNVDWSKDEEMKKLVDKAREIGVDIPEGKYKWNEDEKKLLKENISMRKDNLEKMTQLERTDMQRFLQEASQCHQARSNVLKLLKEVMDTIIANMRP